jgi:hypothetical protein
MGLASSTEVFSRSRSTPWLRVPPPCPFLSRVRTSRCFATGPPSRTCSAPRCRDAEPPVAELGSEKDPLLRFDSPSEYDRGALPERLSPSVSPACASARVRLSWGSSSLRRLTQGAPFLPRSARPTAGDEGYHTLARFRPRASSTRPSSPCGALDRASVAPRRFEPRRLLQARVSPLPQFRRRYAPELSQPVTRPRHVPGIRPSELSLPGEPCRLSAAFCFLAGSTSTVSPARRFPGCPTGFHRAPRPSLARSPP